MHCPTAGWKFHFESLFSLHTDVRMEAILGRNLGDHHKPHANFTDEKTKVQRKEMTCPLHRVMGTVGTRFRFLAWQSYRFHCILLLLRRGFIYSSEKDVIFLGRKCLLLKEKDLLVSRGEWYYIHCLVLKICTIQF